jgi:hypothetical protein
VKFSFAAFAATVLAAKKGRVMKRLFFLVAAMPALGGCVPMMAASAVSMVGQAAAGKPVSNAGLQPQARDACTAQAAKYGVANVIDVEQHSIDRIIVWGTVGEGAQKRSFECDYGRKITAFKLRTIHSEQ